MPNTVATLEACGGLRGPEQDRRCGGTDNRRGRGYVGGLESTIGRGADNHQCAGNFARKWPNDEARQVESARVEIDFRVGEDSSLRVWTRCTHSNRKPGKRWRRSESATSCSSTSISCRCEYIAAMLRRSGGAGFGPVGVQLFAPICPTARHRFRCQSRGKEKTDFTEVT